MLLNEDEKLPPVNQKDSDSQENETQNQSKQESPKAPKNKTLFDSASQNLNKYNTVYYDQEIIDIDEREEEKYLKLSKGISLNKMNVSLLQQAYSFYKKVLPLLSIYYLIIIILEILVPVTGNNFAFTRENSNEPQIFGVVVLFFASSIGLMLYFLFYLKIRRSPQCLFATYRSAYFYFQDLGKN